MTKKNIILIIIIALITIVIVVNNNQKKGTFQELVLNDYLDKAQAKEFNIIEIADVSDKNIIYKASENINIINEFISKLNELELVEYRQGMSGNNNSSKTSKKDYVIFLKNQETDEGIQIHIDSDKNILVRASTLVITENKKDKITEIKHKAKIYRYNVISGNVDFDYLDNLYNSLKEF
ncbi:hypothetical protein SAMN02745135_01399 [Caloranaerobacter azorensis DSM 13643]|uniref:Uncharacterized protein n=1 Tax=Caloranaerobacter azorensis DSM 13643 TaxID=1121264 RepID=A0A1M5UFH5_9FIRM|nr:hypothetical protein [Caloranaerobacter azorensis]SHH61719.1 hypothetical protein SAMN02745135_01399 [Caloranaerobacter azorensis DSM 13643]